MITEYPARMSFIEKLLRLQISGETFELFCSIFVKNWTRYRIKEDESSVWYSVKNKKGTPVPLTRDTVAYHLIGKHWVSTFAPAVPRFLPFDIDPSPAQLQIYRGIRHWVKDLLVFRSSERGGLHAYVFLSPAFQIPWAKLLKITKRELKKRGIEIKPGLCEVSLDPKVSLRLPLGKGSFLLDPETLLPLDLNLEQTINLISTQIRYLNIGDLFPWLKRITHE